MMNKKLYKTFCDSNIDYVKFVKEYTKCEDRVKKLNELDLCSNMNKSEKLLMYVFIKNVCMKNPILLIRKCEKCNLEWFSTKKKAILCEQCRSI